MFHGICYIDTMNPMEIIPLFDRYLGDLRDCITLQPTAEELGAAASWLVQQDLHPEWPLHVHSTLSDLARRLGHGI
ncbi:MAG: hypothetical protein Q8K67_12580 [Geothrix sp.]|nr:hypothetical protein [Geothrix sp.]